MCYINVLVFVSSLIVISLGRTINFNNVSQDAVAYRETEENQNLKNKENRQPVFLPSTCGEGELLYPGDQKYDWICDCRPSHLYHLETNKCWPSHRQGPCKDGYYLRLSKTAVYSECAKNPCGRDKYVMYQGSCKELESSAPCSHYVPPTAALLVNATTLDLACGKIDNDQMDPRSSKCPPGSKRQQESNCLHEN